MPATHPISDPFPAVVVRKTPFGPPYVPRPAALLPCGLFTRKESPSLYHYTDRQRQFTLIFIFEFFFTPFFPLLDQWPASFFLNPTSSPTFSVPFSLSLPCIVCFRSLPTTLVTPSNHSHFMRCIRAEFVITRPSCLVQLSTYPSCCLLEVSPHFAFSDLGVFTARTFLGN